MLRHGPVAAGQPLCLAVGRGGPGPSRCAQWPRSPPRWWCPPRSSAAPARTLGIAGTVINSLAGIPVLFVPFLIAYALGYRATVISGLAAVALLFAALWVTNGSFSSARSSG